MKYLTLLLVFLLTGCSEGEFLPKDVTTVTTELCKDLDGVKSVFINSYPKHNPRYCTGDQCFEQISDLTVTCNKYNTQIKVSVEWQLEH